MTTNSGMMIREVDRKQATTKTDLYRKFNYIYEKKQVPMDQWESSAGKRHLSLSLMIWVQSSGLRKIRRKTKLSSDLHMCSLPYAHMNIHTQNKWKCFKKLKRLLSRLIKYTTSQITGKPAPNFIIDKLLGSIHSKILCYMARFKLVKWNN